MSGHDRVPVRDAATVILVRDAPEIQTLMLKRNEASVFASGAYVFPGGALDVSDRAAAAGELPFPALSGRDDRDASERLGIESDGLAFWIAAVRECFEEAGLLLARSADGTPVDASIVQALDGQRQAVEAGETEFTRMIAESGLHVDLSDVCYFAHWITPVGPPRRYDTRFFVAAAPEGQHPSADGEETVDAVWMSPREALARHRRREIELIFPTLRSLETLDRFESTEGVMSAARAFDSDPAPSSVVRDHSGSRIRLPGDPAALVTSETGGDRA